MRDIQLWWRLHDAPGPELIDELDKLAELSIRERAPFLGLVGPLASHEDPALRRAAIGVLTGARGMHGMRAIVAALDDDDEPTRMAAVAALEEVASAEPVRWAHAVFHGRTDVRAAALGRNPHANNAHYAAYLRVDPQHRAAAEQAPFPKPGIGLLLGLWRREAIKAEDAANKFSKVGQNQLRAWVAGCRRRPMPWVRAFITDALGRKRVPPIEGDDGLDPWVDIIASAPEAAAEAAVKAMADALLCGKLADARPRLTIAVLHRLAREPAGPLPAPLVELATACEPRLLSIPGFPRDLTTLAARGLVTHRKRIGQVSKAALDKLLDSALTRHEDGTLNLFVAAALVGLYPERRLRALVTKFGKADVVAAIVRDDQAWAALCDLPDEPGLWSTRLLAAACEHDPSARVRLTALALGRFAQHDNKALKRAAANAVAPARVVVEAAVQAQAGRFSHAAPLMMRLGNMLAPQVELGELPDVIAGLIALTGREPLEPARAMLTAVSAVVDAADFGVAVAALPESAFASLLDRFGEALPFRDGHQQAIAEALADAKDLRIQQWCAGFLNKAPPEPATTRAAGQDVRDLTASEAKAIAAAPEADLARAVEPALEQPCRGLTAALRLRPPEPASNVAVCAALIGCDDDPGEVAALLDAYHGEDEAFAAALGRDVKAYWDQLVAPSVLVRALLIDFEKQAFALLRHIDALDGRMGAMLTTLDTLPGAFARRYLWRAIASACTLRRYRERHKLAGMFPSDLDGVVAQIIKQLDTDVGVSAAKLLVTLHLGGLNVIGGRKQVLAMAPDMDRDTIHELSRYLRIDGIPLRTQAARHRARDVAEQRIVQIQRERDLDELEERCRSGHPRVVLVAAQRLVELGTLGERRLARLLAGTPPPRRFDSIATTLPDWTDTEALQLVRTVARDDATPAHMQYRLACGLHDRGEAGWMVIVLKAIRVPTDRTWFAAEEWPQLLRRYAAAPRGLALAVTDSSHPHVYRNAMELLLDQPVDEETLAAFRRFLEQGSLRPPDLRRRAAKHLNDEGDPFGLPVLMTAITDPEKGWENWLFKPPTHALAKALGELLLGACVYGGGQACSDFRLLDLLERLDVPAFAKNEIAGQLLLHSRNAKACQRVIAARGPTAKKMFKVMEVADIFAWGVRRGRELTGRLFQVHMTWRRGDFGHTYLNSNSIHVTPLPVLRGDRSGRDVVEALILHEFGHHMYHRGKVQQSVWQRATSEGLGHLLNLVADEHLERNLRAIRPEYGDRLKRLAAYAFQHHAREWDFHWLLGMLGASAFDVLTAQDLGLAFDARNVVVHGGHLLKQLEQIGNPFARFVRALRQGLGNRHEDPLVEEALELFRDRFRHSDMPKLYKITKRLHELFGADAKMAEQVGSHETIKGTPREGAVHGEDIDDDEVQREVERILDPRQLDRMRGGKDDGSAPSKLAVNVIDDDSFPKITNVQRVPPDPERHRAVATEIRRYSGRLRRYFEEMGLNFVPQRARMRGRAFDRTRTSAVVIRRDPRMLVARELTITTDLFIGVIIDCSGSMRTGQSMVKAHRFGVLLAEAARGLANVDARFFGFTDDVIYDGGDQRQCAAASFQAGGGNNDAGALFHAANVADRSRRRSKLLVMISDGLPTECSAVALRSLAKRITRRRGILCAQVAVRPLQEICFPHYVEIQPGDDLDVAVRQFGEIISRLARQALGR